jgi:hypothetical protein
MQLSSLMALATLNPLFSKGVAEVKITFPPHPRAAYSAEELAQWKADPGRRQEVDSLIKRGEEELKSPIVVPDKGGQWEFYYYCPKDNAGLKALSDAEHQCTACGTVYKNERTVAAYRTVLHHQANARCYNLGLAWALSGDDRFAAPVRDVLLKYAKLYKTYERHDRWGRTGLMAIVGGRRYCQHLSEGFGIMKIAEAYDLVYNSKCLSDADRKTIEDEFILATAREIRRFNFHNPGKNNHQTWFNATYAVVGLVCGDETLLNEAVYGAKGFHAQLKGSITKDGIWYEGTIAYHFYALQAMEEIVKAASRVGWDLTKGTRLKEMFTGPMQMAYPNGQFPAVNDGDWATLQSYQGHFRWAKERFGDPLFAPLAEGKADVSGLKSAALEGAGIVALRKGTGPKAVCAMLDYGEHGGHHGHPDKLNLMLYALGRELAPDPGRLSYSVPEHLTWCRQTVAHNLVVVNGKSQEPLEGKLLFFEDQEGHAACLATGGNSYPGVEQRRFLLLTEGFLVDAFALAADRECQMDWILHAMGELSLSVPPKPTAAVLVAENGYQHLSDLKQADPAATFHADWKQPDGRIYRVQCLGDDSSGLFTGNGIGYNLTQKVPFLLRRRTAKEACFLTVHDLSGTGEWVKRLERLPVTAAGQPVPEWEALGLRIETLDGKHRFVVDFKTRSSATPLEFDGKAVGSFAYQKEE